MVSLVLLTYNAEKHISLLLDSLKNQTVEYELIVVDSSSVDSTQSILLSNGIEYQSISVEDFNHGKTRNLGLELTSYEVVVFLTQDVILKDANSLEKLIRPLIENKDIAVSYGRQYPHYDATVFGAFLRYYNYPAHSSLKSKRLVHQYGLKTYFLSNSFAAYKKSLLIDVGGFPDNIILGEDVFIGAKMIQSGYSIQYVAEAGVYHSHNYSLTEEFKRYFDIGVFHSYEKWLINEFPKAEAEGIKFFKEEIKYLLKIRKAYLLPLQLLRTGGKFLGYKMGLLHKSIPYFVKLRISMHKRFWK